MVATQFKRDRQKTKSGKLERCKHLFVRTETKKVSTNNDDIIISIII